MDLLFMVGVECVGSGSAGVHFIPTFRNFPPRQVFLFSQLTFTQRRGSVFFDLQQLVRGCQAAALSGRLAATQSSRRFILLFSQSFNFGISLLKYREISQNDIELSVQFILLLPMITR